MTQWLKRISPIFVSLTFLFLYLGSMKVDQSEIIASIQQDLYAQIKLDSQVIHKYQGSNDDRTTLHSLNKSYLSCVVFRNDTIVFWNTTASSDTPKPSQDLLLKKIKYDNTYATINLSVTAFDQKFGQHKVQISSIDQPQKINIANKKYSLTILDNALYPHAKKIAWGLLFILFVMATILLVQSLKAAYDAKQPLKVWLFSLAVLFISIKSLQYSSLYLDYFGELSWVKTLNQTSLLTQSIGHLLTNLWFFGVTIFLVNIFIKKIKPASQKQSYLTTFAGLFTFIIFGFATNIIEGFVLSPAINLEIESLMEFNAMSFALIICFVLLMFMIFQSTQMIYEVINHSPKPILIKFVFNAIGWLCALGIIFSFYHLHVPIWIFMVFVMSYTLILDAYTENRERKITYLIWWLIMFSGFLAVNLFYFGLKKDVVERTVFLDQYYAESDDLIVNEMIALQDTLIQRDVFSKIASLEVTSKLDMKDLHQFIFSQLPQSAEAYDVSVELFDKNSGATLFNNHFADYYKLDQSYQNARQVGRQVYHNPFDDKYLTRLEIIRPYPINASWYIFIIYQHKNKKSPTLYQKYGFAVISKNKIIEKSDNQDAPDLSQVFDINENKIIGGYSYVISKPSDQYKIVSWKKVSGLIKPISLFSFIFTLSGILLLLVSLVNTKMDFLPNNIPLKFGTRSSLKTKIQLAIILLILFTFLIIGAITGLYFKNLIEANQSIKHKEETSSINNNVRSDIQNIVDDEYALTFLNSKLKELSYIHDKDLSLYDSFGSLMSTTSSTLPAMRMPYEVFSQHAIRNSQTQRYIHADKREYIPIFLNETKAFAYLGIDHSAYNSSGNILDFLSTILNAYIFLFLIAGAIAITIANSITQPLTILAEKLKKFKLGKSNERLEWKSNDEIGTLIYDYNNLTHELERSAGLLAKTERDMAWREMAKQVAHEIKNPLTPMKLSIQYLDRAAKDHPDKAQELIPRISSTLIEQIDNLSQIANEFSNFASMPQATNEKIILNEIVETIHDLFRKRDDMDINMIEPIDDLYVFADKNHLVRILNNLLKNAIQAIPDSRRGKIEIELKRSGNDALIRISDNGTGIPDHMKDKVFTPNFTTKSSGTGLGLAISANMIESFNGKIYFETKVGKGTDFFVAIPLMRLDDYLTDENRVSLD